MSFTQQFEQNLAMGCVCDFDVACPSHPSTGCGACEYACHCVEHNYWSGECGESCPAPPAKPQTHKEYQAAWIADWRAETGDSKRIAKLMFEQMLNQSWDGCTCAEHGGAKF